MSSSPCRSHPSLGYFCRRFLALALHCAPVRAVELSRSSAATISAASESTRLRSSALRNPYSPLPRSRVRRRQCESPSDVCCVTLSGPVVHLIAPSNLRSVRHVPLRRKCCITLLPSSNKAVDTARPSVGPRGGSALRSVVADVFVRSCLARRSRIQSESITIFVLIFYHISLRTRQALTAHCNKTHYSVVGQWHQYCCELNFILLIF